MIARLAFFLFIVLPYTIVFLPVQILVVLLGLPGWNVLPRGFHWLICRMFSIKVTVVGKPHGHTPTLLVCNHISWMDIPVLASIAPVSFVAKSEIKRWPVIGVFAGLQKTIWVQRRRRTDSKRTSAEMAARLAIGGAVLLFAEGASGMGTHVLPFRSALVGAAQAAMAASRAERMAIQPVTIAYTRISGLPIGRTDRSLIAWVKGTSARDNLRHIMGPGTKSVTVAFGTPIIIEPTTDRKVITRLAEIKVREMLVAINRRRALPPVHAG